jgi:hypothetical protein
MSWRACTAIQPSTHRMSAITHAEVAAFALAKINLPYDVASRYRAQVQGLRDRLKAKIKDDPSFDLVKMLHSGSVAKGTALRNVNDLDVAVYVKAGSAPTHDSELIPWLAARLREANPNMSADQFEPQDHCVTVRFRGTGLDVDVVPVLYEGDTNDCGYLVRKHTGDRVLTSIPRHLEFIRTRKAAYGDDFKQLIRLTKWWKRIEVNRDPDFRFKSFMLELLWAHLADGGLNLKDYPEALEAFFAHLVKTELSEQIAFTDYFSRNETPTRSGSAIEVLDPVNLDNNVGGRYTDGDRRRMVTAAHNALDALGEARFATTKGDAVSCWQDILGSGFKG